MENDDSKYVNATDIILKYAITHASAAYCGIPVDSDLFHLIRKHLLRGIEWNKDKKMTSVQKLAKLNIHTMAHMRKSKV